MMAQVKVTSYYSRRKRIDDAQPTKRRKLLLSANEEETDLSTHQADLKAGLQAFTKQLLPKVDRAVLLEDTISQCTKTKSTSSTTRAKSTRKTRATSARCFKTTKGPLYKHLERAIPSPKSSDSQTSDSRPNDSVVQIPEIVTHRTPPSTPTKRPQQSDEAPSRKKRSRIGIVDVVLETDGSSGLEPSRTSRRKVQAGRQSSKVTTGGRSAKKSLEASLFELAKSNVDTKDNEDHVSPSRQCRDEDAKRSHLDQQESSVSRTATTKSTKTPSSKPSGAVQKTSDTSPVSRDSRRLQAFIERTTQSVASASAKESKVNTVLIDRIREAVSDVQSGSSKATEHGGDVVRKTKLTPDEMKERLSKSCKLSDLQARLAKVKECAEQAKSCQKPVVDVGSASKSGTRSTAVNIVKIEKPTMPAYQKYHALVSSAPSTLNLPFKYKLLEEMFRSTDTVVSMLHNRSETCSFSKLKQAVQEMCRRTFEQHNLGQIKTVYPTAYFLRQQKNARSAVNERSSSGYQFVLEANTGSGIGTSAGQESSEPARQPSQSNTKDNSISKLISKFTPSMLIARRSIFHNNLVDIIKEHHNEFLSKLDRPLSVPSDKLTRWHPKFPLEQVPDVEAAALPQPPTVTTYNTAKDVLDKAWVMMNPRVTKALEVVAKNSALLKAEKKEPNTEEKTSVKHEPKVVQNAKSVSGVSQSLLDRIRTKEAQNLTAMMTRNPAEQERIAMLERLPELCRILRVFFVSEKKAAIPIEAVIQKLSDSYPSALSKGQVEKHVSLMVEVLPEWLNKVVVRKDHYLKMNKTKDMSQVTNRVNQLLRDSKQFKGQS